jgi:hypothetical protein
LRVAVEMISRPEGWCNKHYQRWLRISERKARIREGDVMHLEIFEGLDGKFYVRLVARNGRILLVSEGYANRPNACRLKRLLSKRFVLHLY